MMPGAGANQANNSRFTPVDPVRLLKQYKWLLVTTAVVGVGLGLLAYYLMYTYMPEYTAESTIEVRPELSNPMLVGTDRVGNSDNLEMFKRTQALYIQAERNLRDTINDPEVQNSAWYAEFNNDSQAAFEDLVENLTVRPVPETQVIAISVTAGRGQDAAILVNAVIRSYMAWNQRLTRTGRDAVEQVFEQRKNRLEEQISSLRRQLTTIMDNAELSRTETHFNETDWLFQQLIAQGEELTRAASAAQRNYEQLVEAAQSQTIEFTSEELYEIDNSPTIRQIDNKIIQLREELRVSRERFGDEHRTVKGLRDRIRAAETEKNQEKQRMLAQLQDVKISQAESQLAAVQAALADNEKRLVDVRQRQRELREQLSNYRVVEEELTRRKDAYQQFEATLADIDVYREHPSAARVEPGPRASAPNSPSSPQITKTVPGVTILLLMLVSGLVFLREMLDNRIKGPSDTKLLPNAALLGIIPDAGEDASSGGSIDQVVARKPTGLLAENFRQLRTEITAHMQRHRFKTLMVVGCQPRTGNTSIITNLATSVAYNGRKVLLIDANFRQPAIHRQFEMTQGPGLAELVSGNADVQSVIQQSDIENLDVMPIGDGDEHILERVESDVFTQALRQLEQTYDLILVDAPPLSVVGDSRVLANRVDAVVLTVRAKQEKRGLVARLIRQMDDARAEFLGLVLNGVQSSAGGYFRRNYEAYYEYQNGGGKAERPARRGSRRAKTPVETPEA